MKKNTNSIAVIADVFRFLLVLIITLLLMAMGVMRLMKIQLVDGSSYFEKSLSTTKAEQVISAPRGEITDARGEYLVSNKLGFNAVIEKAFFPSEDSECNRVVLSAADILAADGAAWNDVLPISRTRPYELDGSESEINRLRKTTGVQTYATAEECMIALERLYNIDSSYSESQRRTIAGIRYTMTVRDFSVANRFTLAEDISMGTVVKLKEKTAELDGVDVSEEAVRVVNVGDVVPHLIGTVGAISAEEYEELHDKGYSLNDSLGKGGIEKAMEDTLKGQKGLRTFELMSGNVIGDEMTTEARPGNSIKLTIDSDFQRKTQKILVNHINWLNNQSYYDAKGTDADAGAVVVLDVKSGALLSAATYPTYNLIDYINDYSSVANGANAPLTNRATSGRYRPGSTFKTVTATAALNESIIGPSDTVNCTRYYTYWEDWVPPPECTGFHQRLNVVSALRESCNIFFYDVGRIMGIDTLSSYASMYGLGEEMGLEIGRDIKVGYVANPETFEDNGLVWQEGNVIQAAIGQSDTYVTPLQMAAQAMTIANKGVRYNTYMVDSIYSYNMDELICRTEPTIACTIPDKTGYTFYTVTEGMKEAAAFEQYTLYPRNSDYYTDSYLLTDLPRSAAIKTGTPQMTSKNDTSSAFIGFYPANDPEIAFAGFIEHGEYSKLMIKDIIEAYYSEDFHIGDLPETKDPTEILSDAIVTEAATLPTYTYTSETEEEYEEYEQYEDYTSDSGETEDASQTDASGEPSETAAPEEQVQTEVPYTEYDIYEPEPAPTQTSFYDPGLHWFDRE